MRFLEAMLLPLARHNGSIGMAYFDIRQIFPQNVDDLPADNFMNVAPSKRGTSGVSPQSFPPFWWFSGVWQSEQTVISSFSVLA